MSRRKNDPNNIMTVHAFMCIVLQRMSVTKLTIEFSGSGDSGDIDDWSVEGLAEDQLGALESLPVTSEMLAVPGANYFAGFTGTAHELIEQYVSDSSIDDVSWDWCNNDGGGGTIRIYPASGHRVIEGYYNETIQQPADGSDDDLVDGLSIPGVTFQPYVPEEEVDG